MVPRAAFVTWHHTNPDELALRASTAHFYVPQRPSKEINVILHRVPPGYTWIAQPADVVWNHTLKNRIRKRWIENLRTQIAKHKLHGGKFPLKPPNRTELAAWVQDAWDLLQPSTIKNGFKKCHLSAHDPSLTGEEDDAISCLDASLLESLVALNISTDVNEEEDFLNGIEDPPAVV
ncbi:hypothetical protein SPRG_03823 [Saprolegnia parasitica CBS 223.65]|uniref:DDE-1 domain-containing protein n=1 Tax=Saprolegnia parasitica (strain CBS 223.65) TaxID=695850 RepID=A0A067CPR5_SAPPC|nr:hypothetical protein SPRG_03823 [Saprolegnia parasitica CBS 223.65]KDO31205.1 hypothetical protein SPRG_03823 [Saprolegnia parasitica CBS 223.65]|eukprot:XP_012197810.1 hypothetical protein SPRG_03823 [Saprolegnia parasitica CBS 223.65]